MTKSCEITASRKTAVCHSYADDDDIFSEGKNFLTKFTQWLKQDLCKNC